MRSKLNSITFLNVVSGITMSTIVSNVFGGSICIALFLIAIFLCLFIIIAKKENAFIKKYTPPPILKRLKRVSMQQAVYLPELEMRGEDASKPSAYVIAEMDAQTMRMLHSNGYIKLTSKVGEGPLEKHMLFNYELLIVEPNKE